MSTTTTGTDTQHADLTVDCYCTACRPQRTLQFRVKNKDNTISLFDTYLAAERYCEHRFAFCNEYLKLYTPKEWALKTARELSQ